MTASGKDMNPKPGWLATQIESARADVASLPTWLRTASGKDSQMTDQRIDPAGEEPKP